MLSFCYHYHFYRDTGKTSLLRKSMFFVFVFFCFFPKVVGKGSINIIEIRNRNEVSNALIVLFVKNINIFYCF